MRACVVRTGVANIASIAAALTRCEIEPVITNDRAAIEDAELLVLPGVGSFASGMRAIRDAGLDGVIIERVMSGRATLAICLGLQMLARESEESPGVEGLGVLDASVTRFPEGVRVPQFGWNCVASESDTAPFESGYAYFANSYRFATAPAGWDAAYTDYAGAFVSALWRGRVLACQFHPELSGPWGLRLIRRWARAEEVSPC
ncbi:MAG: imidazole glycerol phosphate synthase subunit HisH [Phycisphaerales bacterium]|jgi:imidazole glycerol phosphate synthase glutamine amidotransferase subunit|nr:imidazole glycerol phosphate synthase subunit HisH [Phycisphaerales bacterium]